MGDSKEISKRLVEEGDVYQKVDLAFKVSIKEILLFDCLIVCFGLFVSSLQITLRTCFYHRPEKSLSIKH